MYKHFNPNPKNNYVGDCTVRAVAKGTGQDWDSGNETPIYYYKKEY